MKRIEFRLTMPGVGSWNGKWSGEDKDYLIYRTLGDATTDSFMLGRSESSFRHNFGDGWAARVTARVMNDGERKKKSAGFCGYEWMVENIISYGSTEEPKKLVEAQ